LRLVTARFRLFHRMMRKGKSSLVRHTPSSRRDMEVWLRCAVGATCGCPVTSQLICDQDKTPSQGFSMTYNFNLDHAVVVPRRAMYSLLILGIDSGSISRHLSRHTITDQRRLQGIGSGCVNVLFKNFKMKARSTSLSGSDCCIVCPVCSMPAEIDIKVA